MKTILIVEDNKDMLQKLVDWITTECADVQVLKAETYEEGKNIILKNHLDLLILDIHLTDTEDELGLRLAEQYRKHYPFNTIIFQTVYEDYKYRAAIYDAIGTHIYIPKTELTKEKFTSALEQELERFERQFTNKIFIYQRDKKVPINVDAILYLEKISESKDIKMFTYDYHTKQINTEFISNLTLAKLLKLPGTGNLFRCHKSYIVNKRMIERSIIVDEEGGAFKLRYTDHLVPIGKKFRRSAAKVLRGILTL